MPLNITRNPGDKIKIGSNIVITVKRCDKGRVYLEIDAPRHIRIERMDGKK